MSIHSDPVGTPDCTCAPFTRDRLCATHGDVAIGEAPAPEQYAHAARQLHSEKVELVLKVARLEEQLETSTKLIDRQREVLQSARGLSEQRRKEIERLGRLTRNPQVLIEALDEIVARNSDSGNAAIASAALDQWRHH